MKKHDIVAVLSTTVIPIDGLYLVETIDPEAEALDLAGVPHYIGHPATRQIVEDLGAIPAPARLFSGLEVGQSAVCFAIAQGKSNRAKDGFTTPHQEVSMDDLTIRVLTRMGTKEAI